MLDDSVSVDKQLHELQKEAAIFLNVVLGIHTRDIAHKHYRARLLEVHPDKCRNAPDVVQKMNAIETAAIIAAWRTLENYFDNH